MQQFTDELSSLLEECRKHESILEKVKQFARQGGQHRISIAIDHPDAEIAAAVATISLNHMPCDIMMQNILAHAEINLERAKHKIVRFTADLAGGPAPAPVPTTELLADEAIQP